MVNQPSWNEGDPGVVLVDADPTRGRSSSDLRRKGGADMPCKDFYTSAYERQKKISETTLLEHYVLYYFDAERLTDLGNWFDVGYLRVEMKVKFKQFFSSTICYKSEDRKQTSIIHIMSYQKNISYT